MRIRHFTLTATLAALVFTASAGWAANTSPLTQQAQKAAQAGQTNYALSLYELALTESVHQPQSVFGPLEGQYWQLTAKTQNIPRAFSFFTALAAEQGHPGANLLADKASITGMYIGWLYQHDLEGDISQARLGQMDATERRDYGRALALDPDNFSALYGYAVYESYSHTPGSQAHMKELLKRLDALRASHPHYPWRMVDYLETHGHPEMQ